MDFPIMTEDGVKQLLQAPPSAVTRQLVDGLLYALERSHAAASAANSHPPCVDSESDCSETHLFGNECHASPTAIAELFPAVVLPACVALLRADGDALAELVRDWPFDDDGVETGLMARDIPTLVEAADAVAAAATARDDNDEDDAVDDEDLDDDDFVFEDMDNVEPPVAAATASDDARLTALSADVVQHRLRHSLDLMLCATSLWLPHVTLEMWERRSICEGLRTLGQAVFQHHPLCLAHFFGALCAGTPAPLVEHTVSLCASFSSATSLPSATPTTASTREALCNALAEAAAHATLGDMWVAVLLREQFFASLVAHSLLTITNFDEWAGGPARLVHALAQRTSAAPLLLQSGVWRAAVAATVHPLTPPVARLPLLSALMHGAATSPSLASFTLAVPSLCTLLFESESFRSECAPEHIIWLAIARRSSEAHSAVLALAPEYPTPSPPPTTTTAAEATSSSSSSSEALVERPWRRLLNALRTISTVARLPPPLNASFATLLTRLSRCDTSALPESTLSLRNDAMRRLKTLAPDDRKLD